MSLEKYAVPQSIWNIGLISKSILARKKEIWYDKSTPAWKLKLSWAWIQEAKLSPQIIEKIRQELKVDNLYDAAAVEKAVQVWQRNNGLGNEADGIIGWNTLNKLYGKLQNTDGGKKEWSTSVKPTLSSSKTHESSKTWIVTTPPDKVPKETIPQEIPEAPALVETHKKDKATIIAEARRQIDLLNNGVRATERGRVLPQDYRGNEHTYPTAPSWNITQTTEPVIPPIPDSPRFSWDNERVEMPQLPGSTGVEANMADMHILPSGELRGIQKSMTINEITDPTHPNMTLYIPEGVTEGRGVEKNVVHDIHWDDSQKSYVYSSGKAQWLRPFIENGMILKPQNESVVATPDQKSEKLSGIKKLKAKNKNNQYFKENPDNEKIILSVLSKVPGNEWLLTKKELPDSIARYQRIKWIEPTGYIEEGDETLKTLLQEYTNAKVAQGGRSVGGNNYIPNQTKFEVPFTDKDKEYIEKNLLKEWQTLEEYTREVSERCASFITFMNWRRINWDAWTMPDNIIKQGGQEIANPLRNVVWEGFSQESDSDRIQEKIMEAVRANPIDAGKIQVWDIIPMMNISSSYQGKAFSEGLKTGTRTVSTHIWQVTENNGKLFVTHNIHGDIYTTPLANMLQGTWKNIATWVFRLRENTVPTLASSK